MLHCYKVLVSQKLFSVRKCQVVILLLVSFCVTVSQVWVTVCEFGIRVSAWFFILCFNVMGLFLLLLLFLFSFSFLFSQTEEFNSCSASVHLWQLYLSQYLHFTLQLEPEVVRLSVLNLFHEFHVLPASASCIPTICCCNHYTTLLVEKKIWGGGGGGLVSVTAV